MCALFTHMHTITLKTRKSILVCDAALDVTNGQIGYDPNEPFGENNQRFEGVTATLTCNEGYGLQGNSEPTCTNGAWSATFGTCIQC